MTDAKQAATACTKCGGATVPGQLVWNGPIRFKPERASMFNRGTKVSARACTGCGYIELSLERSAAASN